MPIKPKRKIGGKRGKKEKSAEKIALEELFRRQKDQLCLEEESVRHELDMLQQLERKECKMTKRRETYRLLCDKDREIDNLNVRINDITTSTGKQILKLEDELSRVSMAKEVVVQEKNQLKVELDVIKQDDGGKKMIAELAGKVHQMEVDKEKATAESAATEENLKRKVAKQVAENRLMRITLKETEAEYGQRVSRLETEVLQALEALIMSNEKQLYEPSAVAHFDQSLLRSKREYLIDLKRSKEGVLGLTDTLIDMKSMHSNLPQRIRAKLRELSQEELLIILDVLSFEESVVQYLEAKWPLENELLGSPTDTKKDTVNTAKEVATIVENQQQPEDSIPTPSQTPPAFADYSMVDYSMGVSTPLVTVDEAPDPPGFKQNQFAEEEEEGSEHSDPPEWDGEDIPPPPPLLD